MTHDLTDRFSMLDAAFVRNALLQARLYRAAGAFIDTRSLFPQRRDGAIFLEECQDQGLLRLEAGALELTPAGKAISERPHGQPRSRARAERELEQVLSSIATINASPHVVDFVEEVWVTGDIIEPGADVREIGVHLSLRRREDAGDAIDIEERIRAGAALYRLRIPRNLPAGQMAEWYCSALLFGSSRPALFRELQFDLRALEATAAPRRRMFTQQHGICPEPVIAGARQVKAVTGTSGCAPLRPMNATWLSGYTNWGRVSPYLLFRGHGPEAVKLFSTRPDALRVVLGGRSFSESSWTPAQLVDVPEMNGREDVALICGGDADGRGVILRRSIVEQSGSLRLSVSIDKSIAAGEGGIVTSCLGLAPAVALLAAADAERILRREFDRQVVRPLAIEISPACDGDEIAVFVAGMATQLLRLEELRLEPPAWTGEKVRVEGREAIEPIEPHRAPDPDEEWLSEPLVLEF